jgi:hypothetical protein
VDYVLGIVAQNPPCATGKGIIKLPQTLEAGLMRTPKGQGFNSVILRRSEHDLQSLAISFWAESARCQGPGKVADVVLTSS